MRVGIVGTNGYVGRALLRALNHHSKVDEIYCATRTSPKKEDGYSHETPREKETYISIGRLKTLCVEGEIAVLFSALPHATSAHFCVPLCTENPHLVVIDLSADFRFADVGRYNETYGTTHPNAEMACHAIYGLSEWNREHIRRARIVACPGCYATAVLLALLPVLRYCTPISTISIVASSGISGGGKKAREDLMFCECAETVRPYNIGRRHRHVSEISYHLQRIAHISEKKATDFVFSPQLVPIRRGIVTLITIPLEEGDVKRAMEATRAHYLDEQWVRVEETEGQMPHLAEYSNTNLCGIGYQRERNVLILCSVIDNLGKGAAGQAIQNFNIRFSFPSTMGLRCIEQRL